MIKTEHESARRSRRCDTIAPEVGADDSGEAAARPGGPRFHGLAQFPDRHPRRRLRIDIPEADYKSQFRTLTNVVAASVNNIRPLVESEWMSRLRL